MLIIVSVVHLQYWTLHTTLLSLSLQYSIAVCFLRFVCGSLQSPIDTEAEMVNKYKLGKSVDLPFAEGLMESCTAVANAKFWLNIVLPFALYRLLFLH